MWKPAYYYIIIGVWGISKFILIGPFSVIREDLCIPHGIECHYALHQSDNKSLNPHDTTPLNILVVNNSGPNSRKRTNFSPRLNLD